MLQKGINKNSMKKFYFFIFSSFLFGSGDINLATVEDFESVKGISSYTASAIVNFRERNRGIKDFNELLEINGIGEVRLEALKKEFFVAPVAIYRNENDDENNIQDSESNSNGNSKFIIEAVND